MSALAGACTYLVIALLVHHMCTHEGSGGSET